ncbi:MAG: hypothetical protein EOP54_16955 [Sphingobacteriales bacterium]|nr:MAG: hypothetical protein EOP54_16955 [Sphingobacteriales bacterium]
MKTIHLQLLCALLLCTFICFAPGELRAQNKTDDCKPLRRANRNKSWQFQSYSVMESEYQADGNTIRRIHKGKTDSIYVYRTNGKLLNSFLCDQDGLILSPLHLTYFAEGHYLTDSIVPGTGGHLNWYFNRLLYSNAVRLTEDRQGGTKRYYDSRGKDSLWMVHTSGKLRLMTWYHNGEDSVQRRWSGQGLLEYEKTSYTERVWNDNQKLLQYSFDTLIQKKTVKCEKIWHPTGALASVTYHYFGQHCLTWEYYNEKGELIEQSRQGDLGKLWPVATVEAPGEVYRVVEQHEEVIPLFKRELNLKLAELLCRTKVKPAGTYRLIVMLDNAGKLRLRSMEGIAAEVLQPDMATIFNQLSGAKPAKRNGRTYAQLLELTLKISTKVK